MENTLLTKINHHLYWKLAVSVNLTAIIYKKYVYKKRRIKNAREYSMFLKDCLEKT